MVQYPAPWGGKGEQSEFSSIPLGLPCGTFIMYKIERKKFPKGAITKTLLYVLRDTSLNTLDFFQAFLKAGYGASGGKINKEFYKIKKARKQSLVLEDQYKKILDRYNAFLYNLRHDGLIEDNGKRGKNREVKITFAGRRKLMQMNRDGVATAPASDYEIQKSMNRMIVIFDIPENLRRKRAWLRATLKNLGFEMIQHSVWQGDVKIPRRFIDDLRRFGLIDYVEVAEVRKFGTLK